MYGSCAVHPVHEIRSQFEWDKTKAELSTERQSYIPGLGHHGGCLHEELTLVVGVVSSGVGNIVQDVVSGEAEPLGRCQQPLGAKSALSVDEEALPFGPSHVNRELASNGHRVYQLRFASSEKYNC